MPPQDEETREYRKKIEEQKKLRERYLREKEERRRKAALEKQRGIDPLTDSDQLNINANDRPVLSVPLPQQQTIPTIVNRNQDDCLSNSRNDQRQLGTKQQQQFSPVKQNKAIINVSNQANSCQAQRGRGGGTVRGRGAAGNVRGGRGGLIHNRLGSATTATAQGPTQLSRLAPVPSPAQSVVSIVSISIFRVLLALCTVLGTFLLLVWMVFQGSGVPNNSNMPQRGGQVRRIVVTRGAHSQSSSGVQRNVKISQEASIKIINVTEMSYSCLVSFV